MTVPQATHSMSKFGGRAADVTEWRPDGHSESDKVEGCDTKNSKIKIKLLLMPWIVVTKAQNSLIQIILI